jgi:hypothetical protein
MLQCLSFSWVQGLAVRTSQRLREVAQRMSHLLPHQTALPPCQADAQGVVISEDDARSTFLDEDEDSDQALRAFARAAVRAGRPKAAAYMISYSQTNDLPSATKLAFQVCVAALWSGAADCTDHAHG